MRYKPRSDEFCCLVMFAKTSSEQPMVEQLLDRSSIESGPVSEQRPNKIDK